MKNRYVLDPSGKIKKIDSVNNSSNVSLSLGDFNNIDTTYKFRDEVYKDMSHFADGEGEYHETYFGSKNSDLLRVDGDIITNSLSESFGNKIRYLIESDKNTFGFINDKNIPQFQASFRQLNSFLDTDTGTTAEGTDVIPFVDEFEFYTGVRQISNSTDNVELLSSSLVFIVDYLADVAIEAAVVEALMALNKAASSNSKEGNRLEGLRNSGRLVLGEYILDEVDVFSKYFFEVLNYPIEEGKVVGGGAGLYFLKRLTCYFIGLSEWLVQDRVLDWQKLLEKSSGDKMFGGNIAIGKEASLRNIDGNFAVIVASVVDVTLNSLTNSAGLKRMMLLIKKFHTQKYWVNYQLYSAKRNTYENVIIDSFNYYYFKFFIERVNVGIKIWNRNFAEDSVKNLTKSPDRSTNRLSGELYGQGNTNTIVYNNIVERTGIIAKAAFEVLSGQGSGDLTKKSSDVLKDDTVYNFKYDFNDLSLSNIPTALMFNRTFKGSIKNIEPISKKKYFAKTKNNRLPIALVNKIEEKLESEYMPFYFHDIRTNEIISFHAFIENISDSYSPDYTATGGFGRIDDVRTYNKTTRSISLSFTVAAMNKEDHETMWYYINKLVTMVYPQWTKGESLILNYEDKKPDEFLGPQESLNLEQPFSQVPGNSPLIRLRIGDVIKSNYSRFNLERIFGLNTTATTKGYGEIDYEASGITLVLEDFKFASIFPAISGDINVNIADIDMSSKEPVLDPFRFNGKIYHAFGYRVKIKNIVGDLLTSFYKMPNFDEQFIDITYNDLFLGLESHVNRIFSASRGWESKEQVLEYLVQEKFLIPDDKLVFKDGDVKKYEKSLSDVRNIIMKPFDSEGNINNPITQSYESGMSKGLAGHITQLDLNYNDATWEITPGSKAPMMVKVTMSFAPIHDIPPGLDYKGMPRAVNYNVGDVNLSMFGDPLQKYNGEE